MPLPPSLCCLAVCQAHFEMRMGRWERRAEDRCPPSVSVLHSIPRRAALPPPPTAAAYLLRIQVRRCRWPPPPPPPCEPGRNLGLLPLALARRCLSVCPISGTYSTRLTQSLPPRGQSRPSTEAAAAERRREPWGFPQERRQRRRILSPDGSCRRAAPSVRCGVYTQMATVAVAARLLIFLIFQGSLRKRASMRD